MVNIEFFAFLVGILDYLSIWGNIIVDIGDISLSTDMYMVLDI